MLTNLALMAACGGPTVPLADVAEKFFGLSVAEANKRAALNTLPVATFRLCESQKAPRLIRVEDLAKHMDSQAEKAHQSWTRSQVGI